MTERCGFTVNGLVCAREKGHGTLPGYGGTHRTAEFIALLAKFDVATPAGETTDERHARAQRFNKEHNLP